MTGGSIVALDRTLSDGLLRWIKEPYFADGERGRVELHLK